MIYVSILTASSHEVVSGHRPQRRRHVSLGTESNPGRDKRRVGVAPGARSAGSPPVDYGVRVGSAPALPATVASGAGVAADGTLEARSAKSFAMSVT